MAHRQQRRKIRILLEQGECNDAEIAAMEQEIDRRMDEAIEFAKDSPEPSVEKFLREVEQN